MKPAQPIRLGISACLLGQKVRYDGGHKRDRFLAGTLAKYFEFVPVCPEVGIGLGVPRPPLRLVGDPAAPRAVGIENPALDVTSKLAAYGRRQARMLDDLDGYIFKSRSPSCGVGSTRVFGSRGRVRRGRGVYAGAFLAAQPLLPAEEEDRLDDPRRRDNFLERVFAWHRWRTFAARGVTPARLAAFHAAHELNLLAHGPVHWRALGRLVARAGRRNIRQVAGEYALRFMAALAGPVTRARHAAVLTRAARRIEGGLDRRARAALRAAIRRYRRGRGGLAQPVRLLRRHADPRLAAQAYLCPDPREFAQRYRR